MVITQSQQRLLEILRRHIRDEDRARSDDDFVAAVMARYYAAYTPPLDPNE